MKIQLSDHFTYRRLLRFVFPSILMILCTSVYSIVDGFFVSNFAGKTPFAALNLIMPVLMGVGCIGFMLGTGGSAVIARTLGEGKPKLANEYFTMLVFAAFLGGFIISALGFIFTPQIASLLGATGELKRYCVIYARILFCSAPAFVLQYVFQSFFVAAQKPELSLRINISAGIANIILDYLLIVVFDLGLAGAAIATAVGEYIASGMCKRMLGNGHQPFHFSGKYFIQFPAHEYCRGKRCGRIRHRYVYQYCIYGDLSWLFHRKRPDCQLSLRCRQSSGIKKYA